jgi:hypothetical protein
MPRCAGITRSGKRCQLDAMPSAQWCYGHDPYRAKERSRNASKAGKTGGRGRPGAPEIADVKSGLHAVIRDVLAGDADRGRAAVAIQGYGCLLKAIELQRKVAEQDELLARLEELEAAQGARNGGARTWR